MDENAKISTPDKMRLTLDGADWRWKAAKRQTYEATRRRNAKDKVVQRIADLLWMEFGRSMDLTVLPDDFELWAETFHHARTIRITRPDRIILESLILARFDREEIKAIMNIPVEVIACYEHCFFDLRDPVLPATALIGIAIELPEGSNDDPLRSTILRLVLSGGRTATEACLDYLNHRDESHDLTSEVGLRRKEIDLMVQVENYGFGIDQYERARLQGVLDRVCKTRVNLPTMSDLLRERIAHMTVPSVAEVNAVDVASEACSRAVDAAHFENVEQAIKKTA